MVKVISTNKHNKIIYYLRLGKSLRETASVCNVGKSTISEIKQTNKITSQPLIQGRLAKLSPQNKRIYICYIISRKIRLAKVV